MDYVSNRRQSSIRSNGRKMTWSIYGASRVHVGGLRTVVLHTTRFEWDDLMNDSSRKQSLNQGHPRMSEYSPSLVGLFGSLLSVSSNLLWALSGHVTHFLFQVLSRLSVKSNDACADQRFTQHCDICTTGKQMPFRYLFHVEWHLHSLVFTG